MPSGVMRLRAAKKGGGSNPIEYPSQSTKARGGADKRGDTKGSSGSPGSEDQIWKSYPVTKKATGNESPSRGEHD